MRKQKILASAYFVDPGFPVDNFKFQRSGTLFKFARPWSLFRDETGAAQDFPGQAAGHCALGNHGDAIDQDIFHSDR
jgi:hypothetical protein